MQAIRRVILVYALAAGVPAAAAQQSPKLPGVGRGTPLAQSKLTVYQETLRRYRAGDATAIDDLLAWTQEHLHLAVNLVNTSSDPMRPWALPDIKAAVLMHTEAAFQLLTARTREGEMSAQLEVATRVLVRGAHPILPVSSRDIEARNAAVRAFASRWYVAVSRLLRDRILFNAAHKLLALGRDRLPGDEPVLYESGTMEEFIAAHPSARFTPSGAGRMTLLDSDTVVRTLLVRREQQLNDAARWLRDSSAHEPARVQTQLHLGRVLMLLGRDDESARLLEKIDSPGA